MKTWTVASVRREFDRQMTWKNKLNPTNLKVVADTGNKADEILIRYLPKIRQFFIERIGPAVVNVVKDDKNITILGKSAYGLLPFPVRLAVKEETFVRFCLTHRDKLLTDNPRDDIITPPAAEK